MKYSRDIEFLLLGDGVLSAIVFLLSSSPIALGAALGFTFLADIGVEYKVFE